MRTADGTGVIGMHGFDGSCSPSSNDTDYGPGTFSLGIFEYLPKSGGKGYKRGKAKVRVSGRYSNPKPVYAKAREIMEQLDAGTYAGPKNVRVKP